MENIQTRIKACTCLRRIVISRHLELKDNWIWVFVLGSSESMITAQAVITIKNEIEL